VVRSRIRRSSILFLCPGARPRSAFVPLAHAAPPHAGPSAYGLPRTLQCTICRPRGAKAEATAAPQCAGTSPRRGPAPMTWADGPAGAGRLRCTCLAPIVPWPPLCAGAGVATRSTGRRRRTRTGGRRRGGRHAGRPGTHRARPRTYASSRGPTSRLLSSNVQCQHHPILMVIMPGPARACHRA